MTLFKPLVFKITVIYLKQRFTSADCWTVNIENIEFSILNFNITVYLKGEWSQFLPILMFAMLQRGIFNRQPKLE